MQVSRVLKTLAWIAPQAAMRRARAMALLEAQSRYAGATTGRRGASFLGGQQSANAAIGSKIQLLRARAHEMVRDHWAFTRILDVTVAHAIGSGISVVPDNGNDRDDRKARDAWQEWQATADITGEGDYHGLTALAVRSMLEGGSSLVRMVPVRTTQTRRVPLALQLVEAEQIDHTREGTIDGRRVRLGIALGTHDERLGLYLHREHPGEASATIVARDRTESLFFDRDEVCHLYRQLRPLQVIGVPVFAPILLPARDLADLMDAVIVKAKIEACYAGFIETDSDASPLAELTTQSGDQRLSEFAPGMIVELRPGQKISFGQPSSNTAFEPIHNATLYAMAAGAGVTFDQLTGDLRQANYSSLRAGKIEFRRMIEQLQWLTIVPKLHARITARFTQDAITAGVLRPRRDGWRWTYVMPANEPIDPKKDLEADILAVRSGRMSPQEFIAGWGRDWREVVADYSTFLAEIDAAGLVLDIDPRRVNKQGSEQQSHPDTSQDPAEPAQ